MTSVVFCDESMKRNLTLKIGQEKRFPGKVQN